MPCEIRIATPTELGTLLDQDLFELLVLDVDLLGEVCAIGQTPAGLPAPGSS
jgi:hypothetical protein